MERNQLRVAIIGSGNIGTDLLVKAIRSPWITPTLFVGRSYNSPGMKFAANLGVPRSDASYSVLFDHPDSYDLVFDATSASTHLENAPKLASLGKPVIDLTPAKIGRLCVPAVNDEECLSALNVNMVTCGGQASIPIAHAMGQTQQGVDYIEVISSIASKSAGAATRSNLDEYVHTTEQGVRMFSGARRVKAILNLNPANPCIDMQTTVFAKVDSPNLEALALALKSVTQKIQSYVPGYQVIVGPSLENGRIVVMVRVRGIGDYLPAYAGNLDIINCAAISIAEQRASIQHAQKLEAQEVQA